MAAPKEMLSCGVTAHLFCRGGNSHPIRGVNKLENSKLTENAENPGVLEGAVREDRVVRSTGQHPAVVLDRRDQLQRADGAVLIGGHLLDGALQPLGATPPAEQGRRLRPT